MKDSLNQLVPAQEEDNKVSIVAEEDDDENPLFKRLPDEIIISQIFEKICEAKSLFSCSLVSKHFSSLVYLTKIVSFKIPLEKSPSFFSFSFSRKLLHFITAPMSLVHGLFQSTRQQQSPLTFNPADVAIDVKFVCYLITKFLVKFKSIKSLHMELDYSRLNFKNQPIVKRNMNSKSDSFILLIAKNFDSDYDDHIEAAHFDGDNNNISAIIEMMELLVLHYQCHMGLADIRLFIVKSLASFLPQSLENVVVTDSLEQGKLTVGESDIVEMRNGNANSGEVKMRLWQAPLLKLPWSGSVMKMVNLIMFNGINENIKIMDDFLIVKEAFKEAEEDESVFAEAVMEMVKKEAVLEKFVRGQDLFRVTFTAGMN